MVLRKALQGYITQPVVSLLARTSITPNMVTWFGLILILVAASLAGIGYLFAAGLVVLISGFFDIIDGALARTTNHVTRFGGVLDSTLDRLSEAAILIGIMAYYLFNPVDFQEWVIILIGITMIASFLVSYVRSRAEADKISCQVGIFTRAERVIILALGLLINQVIIILIVIAILSIVRVVQRLVHVYQETQKIRG